MILVVGGVIAQRGRAVRQHSSEIGLCDCCEHPQAATDGDSLLKRRIDDSMRKKGDRFLLSTYLSMISSVCTMRVTLAAAVLRLSMSRNATLD